MAPKGCCCCRLREGVLAIGITFLVLTVVELCICIPSWATLSAYEVELAALRANGSGIPVDLHASDDSVIHTSVPLEAAEKMLTMKRAAVAGQAVELILSLLFNSLLVHGVRRSQPAMLLAWIIFYALGFGIVSLGGGALLVGGIAIAAMSSNAEPLEVLGVELVPAVGAGVAVAGLLVLGFAAFLWYLWAVVFAYRRELQEQTGGYKREMLMEENPSVGPHGQ